MCITVDLQLLRYIPKFDVFSEVNASKRDLCGRFYGFYHENRLVANLQYHFHNQRVKTRKYTHFKGNPTIGLFESTPKYINIV